MSAADLEISRMQLFATRLRRAIRIELNKLFHGGQFPASRERRRDGTPLTWTFFCPVVVSYPRGHDELGFSRSRGEICR